jgi:uncharacterized damage-inducible protein DinB
MPNIVQTLLDVPGGYRSTTVARYVAQMDDLSHRLTEDTRGLGPEHLGQQVAPGLNTIGMLLAHIAVAEVHLAGVGLEGLQDSEVLSVLGIRIEDDGLPLPQDGLPPAALQGKDLAYFDDLLRRARANTKRIAAQLTDEDLARQITRPRPDGSTRVFDVDWMLHHMVEHQAGHYAQINLLKHLYKTTPARV